MINWIYNLFTTETYRLQKETKELDKEIDDSWDELKRMEDLIAKKEEPRRKLPVVSAEGAHEPSAPQQGSGTPTKVPCEVHPGPHPSRYASHPPSSAMHSK